MGRRESLGVPHDDIFYYKTLENQNYKEELIKMRKFISNDIENCIRNEAEELYSENMTLEFINFGDMQLVYVLTTNNKRYIVLVGQPRTEIGLVKREFDILNKLYIANPDMIVAPTYYFANNDKEFYIAPYLFQARSIANRYVGWGIYVPEPHYRFEVFTSEQRKIINSVMISYLVKLFDEKNKLGLAKCNMYDGDFILEKAWSNDPLSIENTLKRMKLIAGREQISISLDEYLKLIKREFTQITYYINEKERNHSILINNKSCVPMTEKEIDDGIELGLWLRKNETK